MFKLGRIIDEVGSKHRTSTRVVICRLHEEYSNKIAMIEELSIESYQPQQAA